VGAMVYSPTTPIKELDQEHQMEVMVDREDALWYKLIDPCTICPI